MAQETPHDRLNRLLDKQYDGAEDRKRWRDYTGDGATVPELPRRASVELRRLAALSTTPWGSLIIEAVAERLRVDGIRATSSEHDHLLWRDLWLGNKLNALQSSLYTAALIDSEAYVLVWPGERQPLIRGISRAHAVGVPDGASHHLLSEALLSWTEPDGSEVAAIYDTRGVLVFARAADDRDHQASRWWRGEDPGLGLHRDWQLIDAFDHGLGLCPVVRMPNLPDLEGDATSDVGLMVGPIDRISETIMGRLTAGKFAAFRQKFASGIDLGTQIDQQSGEPLLGPDGRPVPGPAPFNYGNDQLWTSENPDARFGSLESTDLRPIIEAAEQDVKHLAAVSRTPAHYLLGGSANPPSAEALLAAETGLISKVERRQEVFGETWEQVMRVAASVAGHTELADDVGITVSWRNTRVQSPGAVADAALKLRQAGLPLSWIASDFLGLPPTVVTRILDEAQAETSAQAASQAAAFGLAGDPFAGTTTLAEPAVQ